MNASSEQKPVIGISSCLLGQAVRFDGGHKHNRYITDELGPLIDFVPACPEMAIGLGVPRPTLRLVGSKEQPRMVAVADETRDLTEDMQRYSAVQAKRMTKLHGYILKKDSPSCGMERVKIYPAGGGAPTRHGRGLFAAALMDRNPLLPIEEEGRLNDPVLRENFINRVFVYQRWLQLQDEGVTAASLIAFHSRHKYLVMGHSQAAYKRLGRLLSDLSQGLEESAECYIVELMTALKRKVLPKRHVNVLQHIMGYLKRKIDGDDKTELLESIDAYRRGEIPLVVPVTLLRHYFRRFPDPYMNSQFYLQPYPEKLGLRNHI